MCIRCGKRPAAEEGDYCPSCGLAARLEVAEGLRELERYVGSLTSSGKCVESSEKGEAD